MRPCAKRWARLLCASPRDSDTNPREPSSSWSTTTRAEGHPLDFDQEDIDVSGAAIEARLYAENPANDFLPATGRLDAYVIPETPAVRWDTGVDEGSEVGTDFDPMLAKVIAFGATRSEAAGRLALALERLHLGGVVTNRDFLVATLRSEPFLAGDTTTDFIDRVAPARVLDPSEADLERAARVGALWIQGAHRRDAQVLTTTPSGWRNGRTPDEFSKLALGDREVEVRYRRQRDGAFRFADGTAARIFDWGERHIDVEVDGRRHVALVTRADDRLIVQTPRGDLEFDIVPRFVIPGSEGPAGGLVAPMPGKVIEVRVSVGDRVTAGQTLVLLEAMKMEHPMTAHEDGVVREALVQTGDQIEKGTVLLIVDSDDEAGESNGGSAEG
jgi:propionyl-CoA carboxylase alpha chain